MPYDNRVFPPFGPPRLSSSAVAMHDDAAMDEGREYARLYAIGAIANRNPPPTPEVIAIREANDALFRARKARRFQR